MNFYDVIFAQQKTKTDSKYFGEISDAINVLAGTEKTYNPAEMGAAIIDEIPTEEVTDDIVSVTDAATYPAKGLEFAIEPVQEGSGDPSPTNVRPISGWTGVQGERTGKNLFNADEYYGDYKQSDGTYSFPPVTSAVIPIPLSAWVGKTVTFLFNVTVNASTSRVLAQAAINGATVDSNFIASGTSGKIKITVTPVTDSDYMCITYGSGGIYNSTFSNFQLELGTTATTYEPFQGTSIPITFPTEAGTVYGGKVDVVKGKLLAYPEYDSYNGETLTGKWISSMDAYVAGTTPTIGAQVVDLSGAGTEYDIIPQQVQMLLGDNNVWCDTGDTTLEYKVDLGRYIEKLKASQTTPQLSLLRQAVSLDAVGDVEPITQEIKSDVSERKSAETEEQEKGGDAG